MKTGEIASPLMDAASKNASSRSVNSSSSPFSSPASSSPAAAAAGPPKQQQDEGSYSYETIPYRSIQVELEKLSQVQESINLAWEEECQKYEETMQLMVRVVQDEDGHGATGWLVSTVEEQEQEVPRRNYFNSSGADGGRKFDESLFPYHSSCYNLLDAYDCLYYEYGEKQQQEGGEGGHQEQQPMPKNAVRPTSSPPFHRGCDGELLSPGFEFEPEFMPASPESVQEFLLGRSIDSTSSPARDVVFGRDEFWGLLLNYFDALRHHRRDDPSSLPEERRERAPILLKILKHSLSELQRDLKLAAATLALLCRFQDLDDVAVFRQVVVVVDSECVLRCDFPCEADFERRTRLIDHNCGEWKSFLLAVQKCFTLGLSCWTQEHAVCLASFVRYSFLREFGSLVLDATEATVEGKRKHLLKRAVIGLRAEDEEVNVGRQIPVDIILNTIFALGERARKERLFLLSSMKNNQGESSAFDGDDIRNKLQTYHNCVRTLVSMAESSIHILPENERFYVIASFLIRALFQSVGNFDMPDLKSGFGEIEYSDLDYLAHRNESPLKNGRLSVPFRYAACINNSTKLKRDFIVEHRSLMDTSDMDPVDRLLHEFRLSFRKEPPADVRNVVRGLFLRNLVDVRSLGFGYGDFLLWCRFDISPLDPLLYWDSYAYPCEDEASSDEDEESNADDECADWDIDEDEHKLTKGELRARYDFSLLMLLRAWQAPWTPESHASFQPGFRAAMTMVAKCTYRLGLPHDNIESIGSFLNRDWWPDGRQECWSYECLHNNSYKSVARKFSEQVPLDPPPAPLEYCKRCHVALYCLNKECRDNEFKIGHKKCCCRPPLLSTVPDQEEIQFCVEIFQDDPDSVPSVLTSLRSAIANRSDIEPDLPDANGADALEDEEDDDDDEGSWETVDSDEDAEAEGEASRPPKTLTIYKYFKEKAYDHQQ